MYFKIKKIAIVILALLSLCYSDLFSNEKSDVDEIIALHPRIGYNWNFFSSDFRNFQGSVDCGLFKSGSGNGLTYNISAEKLISEDIYFCFGLGISDRNGIFSIETSLPAREINSYPLSNIVTTNEINTSLTFLELNPEVKYTLIDDLINGPFRICIGLNLSLPINATFDQKDLIKSPPGAVFVSNNKQERSIAKGDITSINKILPGINFSLENLLKTSNNSYFTQQLSFNYFLTDFISDGKWKDFAVRIELGYRFSFNSTPKLDTLPVIIHDKKLENKIITDNNIQKSNELLPELKLQIIEPEKSTKIYTGNEILATLPFVNAIFFQKDSSNISNDYLSTSTELPSFYEGDAIEKRRYLLPRIAEIVKRNPKAIIALEGYTSGSQNENEGLELAKRRAESIHQALVNLGVQENKISVNARTYPTNATNQEYKEGIEENQRVEISIKNAAVQEYVGVQKFAEIRGTVKIKVDFKNVQPKNSVILSPTFYDTLIVCNSPGTYEIPINRRIDSNLKQIDLSAELSVQGIEKEDKKITPLSKFKIEQSQLSLSNFEAVLLFEFDSGKLSEENKDLLRQMSEVIPLGSTIVIYGSADFIGSERRNVKLAEQRARVTEQFIKSISSDKFNIQTTNKVKKYSEDTPEGRFFNRSIRIRVK